MSVPTWLLFAFVSSTFAHRKVRAALDTLIPGPAPVDAMVEFVRPCPPLLAFGLDLHHVTPSPGHSLHLENPRCRELS